jgi:hypothetical protein
VSSPNFDSIFRSVLNNHYALLLLAGALKNEVVSSGLVDPDHLLEVFGSPFASHFDIPREFALADFALEFGEIIVLCAPYHVLLHLYPDPFRQALEMDGATRPSAFAGIKEEVGLQVMLIKADFAGVPLLLRIIDKLKNILIE